jgi:hypothetical protein
VVFGYRDGHRWWSAASGVQVKAGPGQAQAAVGGIWGAADGRRGQPGRVRSGRRRWRVAEDGGGSLDRHLGYAGWKTPCFL